MIISIAGVPGSGKSVLARQLADELHYNFHSTGKHMRQLAQERGVTLEELGKLAQQNPSIDKELDDKLRSFKEQDNLVVDARLAWFFLPQSFKIWLHTDMHKSATRIFKDLNKGIRTNEIKKESVALSEVEEALKQRVASERERYKQYYGLDHYDISHYDCVIDTTELSISETLEKIKAVLALQK